MPQPSKQDHDYDTAQAHEARVDTEQPEPPHAVGSRATPALLGWLQDRVQSAKVATMHLYTAA
jgi:hypothetical protein